MTTSFTEAENVAGQATYGMSNLRTQTTGLPFIVFISQKDDARHAARVKVSPAPKVMQDQMGSYSISPFDYKAGLRLSAHEEKLLRAWIALNQDVLQDYWDGILEYTEDAIGRIQKI